MTRLATTLIGPLAIAMAGVIVALTWLRDLPAEVATHWGPDGVADGFSTPGGFILGITAISVVLSSIFSAVVHHRADRGLSWTLKILAVVPLFTSFLLASLLVSSLAPQRGLADAAGVGIPVPGIVVGLLGGAALAAGGWMLLPKAITIEAPGITPQGTDLSSSDRVLWTRTTTAPVPLVISIVAIAALIVVAAVVAPGLPWLWAISGVIVLLLVGTLSWSVRVDGTGVLVRALLGVPRLRVPLEDIASASVPEVNPLVEFGGWGIRFGAGRRLGVILTSGDALEVHRTDGRSLVVTVADAPAGAALINGLVERRQRVE